MAVAAGAAAGAASMRRVGSRLAKPEEDQRAVMLGAMAALASIVLLSLLILIRSGSAPDWIPINFDAEGNVQTFGTTATIWRMPIFAFFSSAIALGLAWYLRRREPFAAQFLGVAALMVNAIVWVGVITLLWWNGG